ncbi:sigma-54 interaction domain-containing protein [Owenweeksia hongkongensis]|uniref:Response regulator with CheY-like receiver, AAA-type ATPase, and DNA-binding domains n=1 Tax=Owenweeksia hongkongensis (strain DSM 17368 / CIP 108786 / JCM 12287 / NRRL B-23963 / UST20020801) TaxID=926562 RepID=G8R0P0_OWEHD|nr:sigma-54 dependent transcriptional regulator [Owenweeksia hongkongensis]AEV33767.1 response regulator with CheY-like receiver, AAA-type ATPase, and DNA-binding domains [Owenweeksia hongkongensis DSM 17368]
MSSLQEIKQRFGIIGSSPLLDRALSKAVQVASTDISVLVSGESGVGKESIPRIIHSQSHRKHNSYIAVNCGAIPEGTIDSELFGHEKGSFTGATGARKGYFEEADGGTIFLDEVGELPLGTQVRLLRVLETGEFIKVGSSKSQKTDVRIVAATNVDLLEAIKKGKFREDLYYRLNTVEIRLPALRERKEDIHLIFRKFVADFSDKYHLPAIRLTPDAVEMLQNFRWPGNIRQLRNLAEQLSVVEQNREVDSENLLNYLPAIGKSELPALYNKEDSSGSGSKSGDFSSEREILYKVLFDMKGDLNDLKKLTMELMKHGTHGNFEEDNSQLISKIYGEEDEVPVSPPRPAEEKKYLPIYKDGDTELHDSTFDTDHETVEEENLSLQEKELELIKKALDRSGGKRKDAADELGISERTLYRKIKQYDLQ